MREDLVVAMKAGVEAQRNRLNDRDIALAEAWVYGASNFGKDDESVVTLANLIAFERKRERDAVKETP